LKSVFSTLLLTMIAAVLVGFIVNPTYHSGNAEINAHTQQIVVPDNASELAQR
jgi:ABC-type uncharacterized transport system permease subunit